MKELKNIVFDLDGTVIESEEGIVNSVLYALSKLGIKEDNHESLKQFIGPPLIDSFIEKYKLTQGEAIEAVNYYREFFSEKGIHQNYVYDNFTSLLEELKVEKFRLFIATSKPTVFAKKIISHLELDDYFEGIIGSNLDNTRKDKTEIIAFVLQEFCLKRNETLMIGDRKFDIIGAKNNKVHSMGVSYGHGSISELQEAKADFVASNCLEILDFIKKCSNSKIGLTH